MNNGQMFAAAAACVLASNAYAQADSSSQNPAVKHSAAHTEAA
jgi:hypothetical protein